MRLTLAILALTCMAVPAHSQGLDRYGAGPRANPAGLTPPSSSLLSWPGKALRGTVAVRTDGGSAPAARWRAPPPAQRLAETPRVAAEPAPFSTQPQPPPQPPPQAPAASPTVQAVSAPADGRRTRFYSVGREFGQTPDPIVMPSPSVLALSPDVAATFAAQDKAKDKADESGTAGGVMDDRDNDLPPAKTRPRSTGG